ncbi:baseplate J-like protein [Alcanivorax sp. S71-1-4]|uniref:baseplate assembly protein n=1 Tax=Alcanivorax sp. S71-1-4 TaxID=1177159 RepID=UPI00135975B7|nr:baseplate J/gp47 family protein [Alcanivorax sp. S71-1-4]KAF0810435.1 baseplate J-like protein [Alcanivorax sp. S71-1-4]
MSSYSVVDLSRLPTPDVVETLDYEQILADMIADLAGLDPDGQFEDLTDADPAYKILQVCAYREMRLRARINASARAVMLATATGADLDNIVAKEPYNITRLTLSEGAPTAIPPIPAVYESDEALRRRAQLAPSRYSTAGSIESYIFHALGAHPDVLDAKPYSVLPGQVILAVLSRHGSGAPTQQVLDAVAGALTEDNTRPLTDEVLVQSGGIIEYAVQATLILYPGPDENVVLEEARRRAQQYADRTHALGLDVTLSGIYAALHVEGVQNVHIDLPGADITAADHEATYCTSITLVIGGRDE